MKTRMALKRSGFLLGLATLLGVELLPAAAFAGPATDAMQRTSEHVLQLLADDELKQPERAPERRQRLVDVVGQRFSYEEMSKRSLGEHWGRLTEAQRQEFVYLFQTMLAKAYASKIEGYAGTPLQYLGERLANGCAEVHARLVSVKNEFDLDFRLVERAGDWLVFDVLVDGVSLISSYRGQFSRMLRVVSYDELVERMRQKAELPLQARAR